MLVQARSGETRGDCPSFCLRHDFGLVTPRSRSLHSPLFFPTLGPNLPLHRTNPVYCSRPSWPGNHPACHSAECASWSILNRRVDYLAIAKCRTLQHLPRCCPSPPIRDPATLIKNKARGSTRPVLTRIASLLAPMAREL
jgi:hypothetical protein